MSHQRTSPYLTDDFWIELMKRNLAKPYISADFRKRCLVILNESEKSKAEHNKQASLHYPKSRS